MAKLDLDQGWPSCVAGMSVSGNRYCDRPQTATVAYVGYVNVYVGIQELCHVLI